MHQFQSRVFLGLVLTTASVLQLSACSDDPPASSGGGETGGFAGVGGESVGGSADSGGGGNSSGVGGEEDGGTGGTTDPGVPPGGLCTPTEDFERPFEPAARLSKSEIAEGLTSVMAAVPSVDLPDDRQAAAEAIRAAVLGGAHVAATGIGGDCTVHVLLSDGTPISIFDDSRGASRTSPFRITPSGSRLPAGVASAAPHAPRPRRSPPVVLHELARKNEMVLPASGAAYLGQIEGFSSDAIPFVASALEARGYEVGPVVPDPLPRNFAMTASGLRTAVKEVGVLWLSTHGLSECKDTFGDVHYCLATDKLRKEDLAFCDSDDTSSCPLNDADLEDVYLSRAAFHVGRSGNAWYAINENWVRQYFTLAEHALVVLDACDSMSAHTKAFRMALFQKNANTVVGWVNPVGSGFAEKTVRYFFDRVLGGNDEGVVPPQRPFSVPEIYASMQELGLTIEDVDFSEDNPRTPAAFALENGEAPSFETGEQPDSILAPSLQNLVIGNPNTPAASRVTERAESTELWLLGEFGTAPGSVEIGCSDPETCDDGAELEVETWSADQIMVKIPSSGRAASGFVRVSVPAGAQTLTSNAVPLTSFAGALNAKATYLSLGPPGPVAELDCARVHLRADVHPFRMAPEEEAVVGTVGTRGERISRIAVSAVSDTQCRGTIGGSSSLGVQADWQTRSLNLPWRVATEPDPEKPEWWFDLAGVFEGDVPSFALWQSSVFFTTVTVHIPGGGTMSNTQGLSTTTATLTPGTAEPLPPFAIDPESLQLELDQSPTLDYAGNQIEVHYDLKPEAGSAPNSDTEG